MSANLKTASFDASVLQYKIVSDILLNATAITDVTQEAGSLYYLTIVNGTSGGTAKNYFAKFSLSTSEVDVGTTIPDFMVYVAATTTTKMAMPAGIAFTSLSVWAVDSAADAATTFTVGSSGEVKITMVAS